MALADTENRWPATDSDSVRETDSGDTPGCTTFGLQRSRQMTEHCLAKATGWSCARARTRDLAQRERPAEEFRAALRLLSGVVGIDLPPASCVPLTRLLPEIFDEKAIFGVRRIFHRRRKDGEVRWLLSISHWISRSD